MIASTISLAYKVKLYHDNNDFMYLSFMTTTCAYVFPSCLREPKPPPGLTTYPSFVEMCVGVIVSCMPSLSLLARHAKPTWSNRLSTPLKGTFKPGTLSPLKHNHSYEKGHYVNLSANRSEKSVNTTPLHDDIELGQLQTSIQGDTMHGETPPEVMQGEILTRCEMRQWSEKR